jgi:L-alanine-DL-glutamate epimerase-like enolase superfamily enzyme
MSTPTITAVETTVFHLPMFGELRWGSQSALAEARHVLVRVALSDGSEGVAEAPPRPTIYGETAATIVAIIRDELAPRLIGQPADRTWARMTPIRNNHTAKGAIDMAVHDALAQHAGRTLAEQLGATQPQVRVSYILGIGERDEVLAEAEEVVAQGVRVLKVKVGRDWDDDLARIRDLQAMFGERVDLYADANETMVAASAGERLAVLRAMGLHYCEEPLPVEQVRARAALRAQKVLPIIADDSTFTVRDLQRELELDTFDILNIKTPRTGYTESLAMVELARRAGKGVMVGSQAGSTIGAARAAIFAARAEVKHPSELSFFLKLREEITDRPLTIVDGWLSIQEALTVRVDRDRLREMAVHDS